MVRPVSHAVAPSVRPLNGGSHAAGVNTTFKAALSAAPTPAYTAVRGGSVTDLLVGETPRTGSEMNIRSTYVVGQTPTSAASVRGNENGARRGDRVADEVTISAEALTASRNSSSLRARRLADIKAAIEAGTYETEDKLEAAVDRMLQEIG